MKRKLDQNDEPSPAKKTVTDATYPDSKALDSSPAQEVKEEKREKKGKKQSKEKKSKDGEQKKGKEGQE